MRSSDLKSETPTRTLEILASTRGPAHLLTPGEVASRFHVSVGWVRDHATRKQPRLRYVKLGKLLRFRPEDVEEFIRQWCQ